MLRLCGGPTANSVCVCVCVCVCVFGCLGSVCVCVFAGSVSGWGYVLCVVYCIRVVCACSYVHGWINIPSVCTLI